MPGLHERADEAGDASGHGKGAERIKWERKERAR